LILWPLLIALPLGGLSLVGGRPAVAARSGVAAVAPLVARGRDDRLGRGLGAGGRPLDKPLMEDSADRWLFALGTPGAPAALAGFGRRDGSAASWWDWHLLMAAAFGSVAFTALRERRGGDPFAALYLDETFGRIDRRRGQNKLRERFGRRSRRSWRQACARSPRFSGGSNRAVATGRQGDDRTGDGLRYQRAWIGCAPL